MYENKRLRHPVRSFRRRNSARADVGNRGHPWLFFLLDSPFHILPAAASSAIFPPISKRLCDLADQYDALCLTIESCLVAVLCGKRMR